MGLQENPPGNKGPFYGRLFAALTEGDEERARIVAETAGNEADSLSVEQLAEIAGRLQDSGYFVNMALLPPGPLSQQGFYDAIRENALNMEALQAQLQELRDAAKREHGFLRTVFNIFAGEKPLEKVMADVEAFSAYCRENNITFDEAGRQLAPEAQKPALLSRLWDFRFLAAAVGGGLLGTAGYTGGVSILGHAPDVLNAVPGAFFQALPYIALPFISLTIFRAFSEKSILKEAGTFARFGATMSLGILIGLGVAYGFSGMLPELETPEIAKRTVEAVSGEGFNPSEWILHGIGAAAAFAAVYKMAQTRIKDGYDQAAEKTGALSRAFARAADKVINPWTAPVIGAAGKVGGKAGDMMDRIFMDYMNYLGVPAIFLMMTGELNKGFDELAKYGMFYGNIATGMAVCAAALAGFAYLYGARKKEFGEIAKTAGTAFGISSSAATMPVTKKSLTNMGVPGHITNAVVPLGANFNMMGTSLYLGQVAAAALVMFGMEPTMGQMLGAMGLAVATAFGAPGAPASTVIFLDPVLTKAGLSDAQIEQVFKMVLPADRLFDMGQTSLNVTGDMMVALDTHAWEEGRGLKGLVTRMLGRETPAGPG